MNRIFRVGTIAFGVLVWSAAPAAATLYPAPEDVGPFEVGPGAQIPSEALAATGSSMTVWMLVVAGLVVAAFAALTSARRRAHSD